VRKVDDNRRNEPPMEIKIVDSSKPKLPNNPSNSDSTLNQKAEKGHFIPTEEELMVMNVTECYHLEFVHQLLIDNNFDATVVCQFISMVEPDQLFIEEYLTQKSPFEEYQEKTAEKSNHKESSCRAPSVINIQESKNTNCNKPKGNPTICLGKPKVRSRTLRTLRKINLTLCTLQLQSTT